MPHPQTHYFEVEMRLNNIAAATDSPKNGYIDLKMPVWTPGSYLIREYAKNVEGFQVFGDGKAVKSEKIRKNTWRIFSADDHLVVRYRVYAYELSVRTSFLDDAQGYLNGASIFLFHDALKSLPLRLIVQPYANWTQISTGLKRVADSPAIFEAPNYDVLVDSPVSIGTQQVFSFTASGIPHTVAMSGEAQFDPAKLATDMQKVCETAATVVGEQPCTDYTFLVLNAQQGSGGLEHSNSTTLHVSRNSYANEGSYRGFLSLVAHEYFHLWNIKRIRPMALGPFDYENENYTRLLWVAEGFTSFYQEYILLKAGFRTADVYLEMLANQISGVENKPGNRVQSVAEASWDAWIKYYRPNENSINSTVSYYDKGAVIGGVMNLIILANTKGQRSLDDVMRLLYNEYYKKQKRGFSDEEFQKACEQVAGLPLTDFFQKHIYGTEPLDYNRYLHPVGLAMTDQNANNNTPFLGANTSNRWLLTSIVRDSPAALAGLNAGDEIVQIDGQTRPLTGLDDWLLGKKVNDVSMLTIKRDGLTKTMAVTVGRSPFVRFKIAKTNSASVAQEDLYKKWLFIK
ncbi:MAG: M61 family peptidase [Runella slithyformis]|nr:MAG: M61 family peptidase [Runella slithyformis]